MINHHSVMTSSLLIKIIYFSSNIDYNSKTNVFRDVVYLIINECESRRLKDASGGRSIRQLRSASSQTALVFIQRFQDI